MNNELLGKQEIVNDSVNDIKTVNTNPLITDNSMVIRGNHYRISILSDMLSNADNCACDCQHSSNADRIRTMSDEELADFLITFKNTFGEEYEGEASCMEWLQSEAE